VFIKDQTDAIKPYFHEVTALMPVPLSSSLVVRLPVVKKNFRFLWYLENSRNELKHDFQWLSPKFFTSPIDVLRKRNCYLTSKSCVKYVTKKHVHFVLIHAHFVENGFIGANLKRLFDKPLLVVTAHGGDVYDLPFRDEWQKTLAKYVLNEALIK